MIWLVLACGGGLQLANGEDSAEPRPDDSLPETVEDTATESVGDGWQPQVWDAFDLPTDVPTVSIEIEADAMARLDADPYTASDEVGIFTDEHGVAHEVDLNYRGAYALLSVMSYYDLRNWKVKFAGDDRYLDRREWNFNYEPHLRQKLAYDLFRFAGVAVPGAQHVLLELNGQPQGIYTRYEDPDNLHWLADSFGSDAGDLYKAAYDLPELPVCWADLTWLGAEDADYPCHYNKKTNHQDAPDDYSVIRSFVTDLNDVADTEVAAWFEQAFDIDSFLSYLVVSNFIANWDSYPQRPKNYWLYEDRRAERMVYVPWDLDGTFSPSVDGTWNQMGITAPVFYNLVTSDYAPPHEEEGEERPLVRRLMAGAEVQEAYIARYRELAGGVLSADYLEDRLTALNELAMAYASETDRGRLASAEADVRAFIQQRTANVNAELADLP